MLMDIVYRNHDINPIGILVVGESISVDNFSRLPNTFGPRFMVSCRFDVFSKGEKRQVDLIVEHVVLKTLRTGGCLPLHHAKDSWAVTYLLTVAMRNEGMRKANISMKRGETSETASSTASDVRLFPGNEQSSQQEDESSLADVDSDPTRCRDRSTSLSCGAKRGREDQDESGSSNSSSISISNDDSGADSNGYLSSSRLAGLNSNIPSSRFAHNNVDINDDFDCEDLATITGRGRGEVPADPQSLAVLMDAHRQSNFAQMGNSERDNYLVNTFIRGGNENSLLALNDTSSLGRLSPPDSDV
ncbi:hypothetical protein [Parasitella parasitica]|uniref:Uncharacterized protein n=1 Tax=Parasitella parasitica TaxID=35722 RepID=A0A0B7NJV8_9FUNG|nr:hypothetical protein [Parasitella parasitica]